MITIARTGRLSYIDNTDEKGFTLLEAVIVFTIISFILVATMPVISEKYHRYKEKEKLVRAETVTRAVMRYWRVYPDQHVSIDSLKDRGFLPRGYTTRGVDEGYLYNIDASIISLRPVNPDFSRNCPIGLEQFCYTQKKVCLNHPYIARVNVCWGRFTGNLRVPDNYIFNPNTRCYTILTPVDWKYTQDYEVINRVAGCTTLLRP